MNFYQEVTIIKNSEIDLCFLRNKIITKIHLHLIAYQDGEGNVPFGLSFPEFSKEYKRIGSKIRVFALSKEELEEFDLIKNLRIFSDYVHCTSIRTVPPQVTQWVKYFRKRTKTNSCRLARRAARRKNISYEEAYNKYKDFKESLLDLPYFNLVSLSNKNSYKYFIDKLEVENNNSNKFNTFGLSAGGVVPYF